MSEATLLRRDDGAVAVITINRPRVLNAFDIATMRALGDLVRAIGAEAGPRVIVITGSGDKAFSAGGDMNEMKGARGLAFDDRMQAWQDTLRIIEASVKPVIAAINGYAYGGGTELAMACHMRTAAAGAKLGQTEMVHDHIPGAGGTQRLPRMIPVGLAYEYLLTGDSLSAAEAHRLGLVNHVWPDGELMPRTLELAARIAERSAVAIRYLMQAVRDGRESPLETGLRLERALAALLLDSAEAQAGFAGFFDKKNKAAT